MGGVNELRNFVFKVGTCVTELLKLGIDRKYLNLGSRVRTSSREEPKFHFPHFSPSCTVLTRQLVFYFTLVHSGSFIRSSGTFIRSFSLIVTFTFSVNNSSR